MIMRAAKLFQHLRRVGPWCNWQHVTPSKWKVRGRIPPGPFLKARGCIQYQSGENRQAECGFSLFDPVETKDNGFDFDGVTYDLQWPRATEAVALSSLN